MKKGNNRNSTILVLRLLPFIKKELFNNKMLYRPKVHIPKVTNTVYTL